MMLDISSECTCPKVSESMDLWVATVHGRRVRVSLTEPRSRTVFELKQCIREELGISPECQLLSFQGHLFADEHRLEEYNVQPLGPGGSLAPLTLKWFGHSAPAMW